MKNIIYITLAVVSFVAVSCQENIALLYEDDPALYFVNETYGQKDSINHSFFLIPGDGPDTIYIQIQTMGNLADVARPFKIDQVNIGEEGAAVPDKHFVAFDNSEVAHLYQIPANTARYKMPLILLRDKSLDLEQVRLELRIGANEYFRPGINTWCDFLVKTTAQAVKPTLWDTRWSIYFGPTWGSVKMKFIIDVTGYTDWDTLPSDFGYLAYMQTKVLSKFQEYNEKNPNNPLKEPDGTLVTFSK